MRKVTDKHKAELQKRQTEKSQLAFRLQEFEKSAAATLGNAKESERLATEKQLQAQMSGLTKRIAELEAAQTLADEKRKTEVARIKAELETELNSEPA